MNQYSKNRKKVKRTSLSTYCPILRPCLDSLPLPKSFLFHATEQHATPSCLKSCITKLPVCHCVNKNYCTEETCSDSNECQKYMSHFCPNDFKNFDLNKESLNEKRTDVEEFGNNQEFIRELDLINFNENLELPQEDVLPVKNRMESQASPQTEMKKLDIINRDPIENNFLSNNHIASNASNLTIFAESQNVLTERGRNSRNSNFYGHRDVGDDDLAMPKKRIPDMSLSRINRSGFDNNMYQSVKRSSDPGARSNGTSTSQLKESMSLNYINESQGRCKDASNQCCLPPYIQATRKTESSKKSHIESMPRLNKRVESFTQFNNSNGVEKKNESPIQNIYKSKSTSHELNTDEDFATLNKIDKAISSKQYVSLSKPSSNKHRQSRQSNTTHDKSLKESIHSENMSPKSISGISKAKCCKGSENSTKKPKLEPNNSDNRYNQIQTKLKQGWKNQLPNYGSDIDVNRSTSLTNTKSNCCHGFRGADSKRMISRKPDKELKKSIGVECGCSEYTSKLDGEKDYKCKKNVACPNDINSKVCASISCVMNQISGCRCRYPPSFKQFSCVGNITGSCNCNDNN